MKIIQPCLTLCDPMDYIVHGSLQARIPEWIAFPSPGDLPNPGIQPRSPALLTDSLPAEPQEKPKNTGVDSLSLLQWIFPTQESNWSLLNSRQILYQLSYQGRPTQRNVMLLSQTWNHSRLLKIQQSVINIITRHIDINIITFNQDFEGSPRVYNVKITII